MKKFDVIVIGGGPGGYTAAARLARAGKSVCLFEAENLGGTCLNVGCIPTKYLLDKAAALDRLRELTEAGILRGAGEYSMKAIVRGRDGVTERLRSGVAGLLRAAGVTVINKKATVGAGAEVSDGTEKYRADDLIIATGSDPWCPPFPGAELCRDSTAALTPNKMTDAGRFPRRLAVIGGGVIGLELGSAYRSFGADVTVIEAMPDILGSELPEAAARVRRGLEERGIRFLCGSPVERVERAGDSLRVITAGGTAEADAVLAAVGRRPRLAGIDVEALGLKTERGAIVTDSRMRTSVPHIYAIGDVTGHAMLAHAAYAEAEVAVEAILTGDSAPELDLSALPRCIYSAPSISAVGITPAAAEKRGIETVVGKADYAANGMALAENVSGCVYVVADKKSGAMLGVFAVGAASCEIIDAAALAVRSGMKATEWRDVIVAHPTLSETLKDAALSAAQKAL